MQEADQGERRGRPSKGERGYVMIRPLYPYQVAQPSGHIIVVPVPSLRQQRIFCRSLRGYMLASDYIIEA